MIGNIVALIVGGFAWQAGTGIVATLGFIVFLGGAIGTVWFIIALIASFFGGGR